MFERRVGETFALGNNTWRIEAIEAHQVVVSPAGGNTAVMPFWRGEGTPRSPELGEAVGALCREIVSRLDDPGLPGWLERECRLEPRAARQLIRYVARQQRVAGVVPDDRTILVETFRDPAGELGLAILSPFGGKIHQGLKIALLGRIRQRFGVQASCLHGDDGLLIRLPQMDEPPLDLLDGLTADEAERLIRLELPETALYGLRFRQNAGRALLMPRPDPSKRTPLWLQRLRAKDLLQVVGKFPDFPIVVETFRECLDHDLELARLRSFLDAIAAGAIRVVTRQGEIASPFASELIFQFTPTYLYEWDEPRRADLRAAGPAVDEDLLDSLLQGPDPADCSTPGRGPGRGPAPPPRPRPAHGRGDGRDAPSPRRPVAFRAVRADGDAARGAGGGGSGPENPLARDHGAGPLDLGRGVRPVPAGVRARRRARPGGPRHDRPPPPPHARPDRPLRADPPLSDRLRAGCRAARALGRVGRGDPPGPRRGLARTGVGRARKPGRDPPADRGHPPPRERRRASRGLRRLPGPAAIPPSRRRSSKGPRASSRCSSGSRGTRRRRNSGKARSSRGGSVAYRPAWLDELLSGGSWLWRAAREGRDEPSVALVPRDFAGDWPGDLERR